MRFKRCCVKKNQVDLIEITVYEYNYDVAKSIVNDLDFIFMKLN